MFRATMCPSSGEITISATLGICHSVWITVWYAGWIPDRVTQSDKYQVSHKCIYFSWWWAHSRPKHIQKRNKDTKKNCAPSWLYLQDFQELAAVNFEYGFQLCWWILTGRVRWRFLVWCNCNQMNYNFISRQRLAWRAYFITAFFKRRWCNVDWSSYYFSRPNNYNPNLPD